MAEKTSRTSNFERETLHIFLQTVWQGKPALLRSLVYPLGVLSVNIVVPFLISSALAGLATHKASVESYLLPLVIAVAVGVFCNWYGFTNLLRLHAFGQAYLLERCLRTILSRSVGFHANTVSGKLVSNALDYPAAFDHLLDGVYINLGPFSLTMVIGIVIVITRSIAMGFALLAITIMTLVLVVLESRRRKGMRVKRKIIQNSMIAHFSDTIINAQAAKTFAREQDEISTHRRLSAQLAAFRLRDWSVTARSGSIRMGVLLSMEVAMIAFIGYLVRRNPGTLAAGIFSFSYMINLTNRLFDIGTTLRNIDEAFLSAASMTEILLQETEITDAPRAKKLRVTDGAIDLDNVQFAYPDAPNGDNVFENLTLHIPAGQKVGLVGPSGGGKSTFTRLLLRFDDINEGAIAIDGQSIRTVTQASLRQAISYVPQEPLLFHRSIFENIAYGKPDATKAQVERAARLAYADEFIDRLPERYETIVGERGVKLSGGQRQRVAIARAILKDAPILILDEATSALDSESEIYIQKALQELMNGRTTLVVAHRLSTIQQMDRIIVLERGVIVEDGTHTRLRKKRSGLYARLWQHQSGGFIEE